MRTLLLLRHAKSDWGHQGLSDHERPLNKRGRRDAPRMGQVLVDADAVPERILSSSAQRTRETVALLTETCGEVETEFFDELYLASPEALLRAAAEHGGDAESVMVVAHNPGIGDLVSALAGHYERMPTAALARFELDLDSWDELTRSRPTARLVALWRPKELD